MEECSVNEMIRWWGMDKWNLFFIIIIIISLFIVSLKKKFILYVEFKLIENYLILNCHVQSEEKNNNRINSVL